MKRLIDITILSALTLTTGACSSGRVQAHPPQAAQDELRPLGSLDQLPDMPTKPEGGVDLKRKVPLSPEETMARIRRNAAYPVTFGKGAAGLTFETTLDQSLDLLSDPYGANDNEFYYKEGVVVPWAEKDPQTPEAFYVIGGYTGVLEVPDAFGDLSVGGSAATIFANDNAKGFLEAMGRHTMAKDATYSCINDKQCELTTVCAAGSDTITSYRVTFPGGGLVVANDEQRSINYAYVVPLPKPRTAALKDPVDLTQGAGGISLGMTRAEIEQKLGQPIETTANGGAYDNGNIIIEYGAATSKPAFIQIQRGYEGPVKLTATLTNVMIGQSMREHFTESAPNGETLIKEIARLVEGKPATYDCLTKKTCEISANDKMRIFTVKNAILAFELRCERKLLVVQLQAPKG